MRLPAFSALPFLLALSACSLTSSVGRDARLEQKEAEQRVLAAYHAVQNLETLKPGASEPASSATLSLFRPPSEGVDLAFLELVNSAVNQVAYRSDETLYGAVDYWAQPSEFFAKGGDCEDFAMAKMAILRAAGVPESDMGIEVLMRDDGRGHAVLVATLNGQDWALDNLDDRLIAYGDYPGQGYYRIGFGVLKVFEPVSAPVTSTTR